MRIIEPSAYVYIYDVAGDGQAPVMMISHLLPHLLRWHVCLSGACGQLVIEAGASKGCSNQAGNLKDIEELAAKAGNVRVS